MLKFSVLTELSRAGATTSKKIKSPEWFSVSEKPTCRVISMRAKVFEGRLAISNLACGKDKKCKFVET